MLALFSTADELLTSGARLEKLIVAHPALVTTFNTCHYMKGTVARDFFRSFFACQAQAHLETIFLGSCFFRY